MEETTKIKIDSGAARADLAALSKSLDAAAAAAGRMEAGLAKGVGRSNTALQTGAKNMEKFAQIATLVSKIKISGDPARQVTEFANALNALGRARTFDDAKIKNLKEFIRVLPTLKVPTGARRMTEFLNAVGNARAPSASVITRLNDFIRTVSSYRANAAGRQGAGLESFFRTLASIRVPSAASIERLEKMFRTLESAKAIPNANRIARDLDHIAASAARASAALNSMPARMRGVGGAFGTSAAGAERLHRTLRETPAHAARANRGFVSIGSGLNGLTTRFRLTYQAGTLFSAMFSAFTFGQFVKGVYDSSISMQKLEKAMLFVTGSFKAGHEASKAYLALSDQLGMRALANADAYSRFAISSAAIGASLKDVNSIFRATGIALTSVGANTQQWEYALYGLSQAMAKGKITSEEFNRQIGEQIPGNVSAGVKALSRLRGQTLTANDFFNEMKKGAIQSLPFLKLWAEEIDKMFTPLLPVAEKRPDFQLNRLLNVFDRFKIAVGQAGFIGELTNQFRRLSDIFVKGSGDGAELTDVGKRLANSFGKGLADVVRHLGDAIEFAATHIDEIVAGLKALLVLSIASTFNGWAKSAEGFAASMWKVATATLATRKAASAAAGQAAVNATTTGALATPMLVNGRVVRDASLSREAAGAMAFSTKGQQSYEALRAKGYSRTDAAFYGSAAARSRPDFWKRGDVSSNSLAATPGVFGRRAPYIAKEGFDARQKPSFMTRMQRGLLGIEGAGNANDPFGGRSTRLALQGVTGSFKVLRGALNMLPGLAIGAAVALALFGDKIANVKGVAKGATYNDVAAGVLGTAGKEAGAGISDLLNGLFGLGKVANGQGRGIGDWLIDLSVGLISFGKIVFTVASTIGKIIGVLVADLVTLSAAIGMALSGNFKGAKAAIGATVDNTKSTLGEIGEDWKKALDFKGLREDIVKAIGDSYAKRMANDAGADAASKAAEAANAQIEAALQQQRAADANMRAASDMKDATAVFKQKVAPLNYKDIRADIVSLMNGTYASKAADRQAESTANTAALKASTPTAAAAGATGPMTAPSGAVIPLGTGQRLYASAYAQKGLQEKRDSASLSDFFRLAGFNIDPDKVKWCAAFVNAVLAQNGMQGTGSLAASSFTGLGEAVTKPEKGDIVILKGHVGFFDSFKPNGDVNVLGGNQGDKVGIDAFKASDVVGYRRATAIGATPGAPMAAAGGVPVTDDQAENLFEKRANAWKSLQSITGGADPAAQAISDYQTTMERLRDVVKQEQELAQKTGKGFSSFFDERVLAATDRAVAKLNRDINDAINPIGKEIRLTEQSNDVMAQRVAGLSEAADWQERLNELDAQGYDVSLMKDEATWTKYLNDLKAGGMDIDVEALKMSPAQWAASRRRTDNLQLELDLVQALNDAQIQASARRGTAYDNTVNALVAKAAKPGETMAQTMDRLSQPDSKGNIGMDLIQQQAGVIEGSRRDQVKFDQGSAINELLATKGMNQSKIDWRSDYKAALKDITGAQSDYLGDIEAAATDADKAWAKYIADVRHEAENPPGFQKWADALQPFADRLQNIKAEFLEDLSGGITDAIMGDKVDFGQIFKDMRKKIIKARVDQTLGGIVNIANGKTAQGEASTGSIWSRIGTLFTGGGATPTDPATKQAQAADSLTGAGTTLSQAAALQMQAASVMMGGAGVPLAANDNAGGVSGFLSSIKSMFNSGASAAPSTGGFLSSIGSMFGSGGSAGGAGGFLSSIGSTFGSGGSAGGAGGLLSSVGSMFGAGGGAGGGIVSAIGSLFGSGAAGGASGGILSAMGSGLGSLFSGSTGGAPSILAGAHGMMGAAGGLGHAAPAMAAAGGGLGGFASAAMAVAPLLLSLFGGHDKAKKTPVGPQNVHGVIGESRGVDVTGKLIEAHANPTAQILSALVSVASSMMGVPAFKEGGMTTSPVTSVVMHPSAWANAPHYSQGTHNTSGIPAIVHPDEAVIPLSRGRKIPVDMGDAGGGQHVFNSNITIVAPDPNAFRESQATIERKQSRQLRRSSLRNLSY